MTKVSSLSTPRRRRQCSLYSLYYARCGYTPPNLKCHQRITHTMVCATAVYCVVYVICVWNCRISNAEFITKRNDKKWLNIYAMWSRQQKQKQDSIV